MSEFLIVKPPRGRAKIIFDLEIVEPDTDGTSEWSESSGIADSDDDVSYISDPGITFESPDETSASDSDDDSSAEGSDLGEDTEDDDASSSSESLAEGESRSDSDDDAPAAPKTPKFFIPKHHLEMIESGEMTLAELKKLEHTDLLRVATHPKMAPVVEKEFGLRGVYLLNHITIRPHQLYVLKWMKDIRDKFLAGPDPLECFSKKAAKGQYPKGAVEGQYSAYHDPKSPDYGWEMKGPIASPTMGLGKTLMAIVDTLSTPKVTPYATLVVVSKTVMNVWRLQTRNFFGTGPTAPKILFFHSQYMTPKEIASVNRQTMKDYEFVITTYDFCKGAIAKTLSKGTGKKVGADGKTDGKTKRSFIIDECITYGDEHTLMKGKIESVNLRTEKQANRPEWTGPLVLYGTPFERVIADESQRFTNPDSDTFQAMMALYGKFKLCLTATSIKNKGLDRWCQYRFLGYSGVREKKIWKESGEKYNQTHGMNRFVMEMSLDDAGIELPPKYENDIYLTLVGMELEVADIFNKRAKSMYEQHLQKLCSSACILAMLQKLRLASIAPCLTLASAARLAEQKRIKAGKALAKKGADAEGDDDADEDAEAEDGKKAPKRKTDDPPIDFEALVTGSEQGKWIADRKGTAGIRSAKMLKLIELLKSFPPGEKTVIFSTFTMALDLVEEALEEFLPSGKYQRIDGGTEGPDRERALHDFTYNPKCLWMLMTLKVGGEGIDLTVARKTVLLDPWWNTSAQDQAKARTYRCGQLRPTYMFSFYIHDSVEQRVLKINNEKKDLIDRFSTGRTKRGAKDEKIDLGKLFA